MGDTRQQYDFGALYLCRVTREEEARLPNLLKTCPDKVMAISYTLVQRKDMSRGALEDAKLYYAQAVSTRRVEFDDLCDEIAETCTLTSADIKAVLDRVIWGMVTHLKNSEIVQFGDLGNFRIAVGQCRISHARRIHGNHAPQAEGSVPSGQALAGNARCRQVRPLHRR